MTEARAQLRLEFSDVADAAAVEAALRADDDAFASTRREGTLVIMDLEAPTVRALHRALDDALACASVAEEATRVARGKMRGAQAT